MSTIPEREWLQHFGNGQLKKDSRKEQDKEQKECEIFRALPAPKGKGVGRYC